MERQGVDKTSGLRAAPGVRGEDVAASSGGDQLLDRVINSIGTGIACFDPRGRCVTANACFTEMLEMEPSRALGLSLSDLLSRRSDRNAADLLAECAAGHSTAFCLEPAAGAPDASTLSGTLAPLRTSGSGFEGAVLTLTDITEQRRSERTRRQAEAALRESEARLKEAQRIAVIGSWDMELASRRLSWSEEVYRICEVDAEGFGGCYQDFLEIVHPDDREDVDTKLFDAVRERRPFITVHRLLMPDGRIKFVQERAEILCSDGEPTYATGTIQDVTDRRRLEDRMHRNQASLERAGRINTLGEMASTIAHELNQPLMAIGNYAGGAMERLRRGPEPDEKLLHALGRIAEISERSADIVQWIRAFVGKRSIQKTRVDLHAVVKESLLMARPEARRNNLVVREDLEQALPGVVGDPVNLQQVLVNLVLNAVEASADTPPPLREIVVAMKSLGAGVVEIAVADYGSGLDPEVSARLFQPFVTTKPAGIGLGLSIARTIAEEHGGELSASPNEPRGTVFRLRLPAVEERGRG